LELWKPGRDIAINESILRYTSRAKEITTVPNKPTPTGLKVWNSAQRGFIMAWCWHRPGRKHGPVGVIVPKRGKKQIINKTQAFVLALLAKLPPRKYHVYMDNLFTSNELFLYLCELGHTATGTCRTNSGVVSELVELKRKDKGKDQME
jgi:hypothetical protein